MEVEVEGGRAGEGRRREGRGKEEGGEREGGRRGDGRSGGPGGGREGRRREGEGAGVNYVDLSPQDLILRNCLQVPAYTSTRSCCARLFRIAICCIVHSSPIARFCGSFSNIRFELRPIC